MKILFVSHTPMGGSFVVGSHHLARAMTAAGHAVAHLGPPVTPAHVVKFGDHFERQRLLRWFRGRDHRRRPRPDAGKCRPVGARPSPAVGYVSPVRALRVLVGACPASPPRFFPAGRGVRRRTAVGVAGGGLRRGYGGVSTDGSVRVDSCRRFDHGSRATAVCPRAPLHRDVGAGGRPPARSGCRASAGDRKRCRFRPFFGAGRGAVPPPGAGRAKGRRVCGRIRPALRAGVDGRGGTGVSRRALLLDRSDRCAGRRSPGRLRQCLHPRTGPVRAPAELLRFGGCRASAAVGGPVEPGAQSDETLRICRSRPAGGGDSDTGTRTAAARLRDAGGRRRRFRPGGA